MTKIHRHKNISSTILGLDIFDLNSQLIMYVIPTQKQYSNW